MQKTNREENIEYSKEVIKHFLHPKNIGEIENADAVALVANPICMDTIKVYLKIRKNKAGKEIIKDIKFRTMGCAAAIATSDVLCELVKGKTLKQAQKITDKDIIKELKRLPAIKHHCSLLGINALHKAIKNYLKKK